MKEGRYSLVDVRSNQEFVAAHLPGAIHIPMDALQFNLSLIHELPRPIIVYCHSGYRSGIAVEFMQQHNIEGAINGGGLSQLMHLFDQG
ncbi:MAG: rhodanese-like domain-containing protein [Bacteroidota bacterium]|jgi:phage shock protein E